MRKSILFIFVISLSSIFSLAQNGLNFDNVDDYITTTYPGVLGNNPITVEAWVNADEMSGESVITAWGTEDYNGGRFTFRIHQTGSSDVIRIEIKGGYLIGSIDISDGEWHHVAVTYNPGGGYKYKLYVDGELDVQGNIAQPLNIGDDIPLRIGRRIHVSYTGWFGGDIDEIRVWDYARSQAEIEANMNTEFCAIPDGLVAYYQFNEGIAGGDNTGLSTLPDLTPSANHGTLNSFELTGTVSNWIDGVPTIIGGAVSISQTLVECAGTTITVGDSEYSETGVYTDILTTVSGCDSTVTTDLTIMEEISGEQTFLECAGTVITVGDSEYSETGIYTDILTAASGCDSVVTTDLTILDEITSTQTLVECAGTSVTVGTNTYSETGTYTDILVAANGCDSTVTTDLTILPTINTDVTEDIDLLTANATGASYQWVDCDNDYEIIDGATDQNFTPSENGNYAVIITIDDCSDTSACVSHETSALKEMEQNYRIYPNPAPDQIFIRSTQLTNDNRYTITDLSGKIVVEGAIMTQDAQVNVSHLIPGVYIIRITGESTRLFRFIKN